MRFFPFVLLCLFARESVLYVGLCFQYDLCILCLSRLLFQPSNKTSDLILIIFLIFVLVFCFKSDSSLGRLLIYKVAFEMFKQNFFEGIGIGNFQVLYGHYQAAYFGAGQYSIKELLLADNTYYAFNDYFQLIIEIGIDGLIILILIVRFLLNSIERAFKGVRPLSLPFTLLITCCAFLISLAVAALFTHIIEQTLPQVILLISITIILYYSYWSAFGKLEKYLSVTIIFILPILFLSNFSHLTQPSVYEQWDKARTLRSAGYNYMALELYQGLFDNLNENGDYLLAYGDLLLVNKKPQEALIVLERATRFKTSNQLYLLLGENYEQLGEYAKAEKAYLTAVYMVPNRFKSRYILFRFYVHQGCSSQVRHWGNSILSLPAKVPSLQVNIIRENVLEELKNYQLE